MFASLEGNFYDTMFHSVKIYLLYMTESRHTSLFYFSNLDLFSYGRKETFKISTETILSSKMIENMMKSIYICMYVCCMYMYIMNLCWYGYILHTNIFDELVAQKYSSFSEFMVILECEFVSGCTASIPRTKNLASCNGGINVKGNEEGQPGLPCPFCRNLLINLRYR